ncbi:hypothetical protein GFC01_04400 [Desulfofundulus thermobenzoicus]|uniref:Uncharacterized protein n=1 Tax=Desulfofundulus thermobenzoicus TaxID=29376 RepID=A0A6N7IPL4_9FIRM|nr:hypothetical protein [Desulfofundulus thermobenzoicus]MQL51517.1 hypothetical protein [Desulfofundulus thermobenzoicus]
MSENKLTQVYDMVAQLIHIVGNTNAAVEELRRGVEDLCRGQDELRRGQDELRQGQDELRQGQDELRRSVEELRRGQEEHRLKLAALEGRMDYILLRLARQDERLLAHEVAIQEMRMAKMGSTG